MAEKTYLKSPMNYIGGKYRILPQILRFFPRRPERFADLFAGGLDVAINVPAQQVYCNDINRYVIGIYQAFQERTLPELLAEIEAVIARYALSETNQDGYLRLREEYNRTRRPIDLYVLICHSFNYQIRFNASHEYNNPFGRNRSWFNPRMRENLIRFHGAIRDFHFSAQNFRDFDTDFLRPGDFLYADPPYRISTGSYNDGKRGFEGWSTDDDLALFDLLDRLDRQGVRFALSNVSEHHGRRNQELITWKRRYHTHRIACDYNNSNYQSTGKENRTREILVTNY